MGNNAARLFPICGKFYVMGRDRRNRYSGNPQLKPMQNVAGIAAMAEDIRQ